VNHAAKRGHSWYARSHSFVTPVIALLSADGHPLAEF
jgi:hypothetical protein